MSMPQCMCVWKPGEHHVSYLCHVCSVFATLPTVIVVILKYFDLFL